MRPIDADELKKKSRCIGFGETGRRSAYLQNWVVSELDINAMPTIELPIKTQEADIIGKIIGYDEQVARYENAKCGNCGYEFMDLGGIWEYAGESYVVNYCPNCGYKLRKAEIANDEIQK